LFTTSSCTVESTPAPSTPVMGAAPNPGSSLVKLNFNSDINEDFTIIAIKQSNGQVFELFQNYIAESEGNNTVNVNTDILDAGIYTILSLGTVHNYYCHWIKL
jgi:methionine-rich copper-binding protein CopC